MRQHRGRRKLERFALHRKDLAMAAASSRSRANILRACAGERSWSYPSRWRNPWISRVRRRSEGATSYSRDCASAVSIEITTSPSGMPSMLRTALGATRARPRSSICENDSTSVARSFLRYSRLSARIDASVVSVSESSQAGSPAAVISAIASHLSARLKRRPFADTHRNSTPKLSRAVSVRSVRHSVVAAVEGLIRKNDSLHQSMPHDIAIVENRKIDAWRVGEHGARFLQPRQLAAGQIDLRDIAGHHRLRVVAEPRQEHLHLLGGGVLRLIEDNERIVERAPAHEGQRRDLDSAALEHAARAIEIDHVMQRIIERAQVRIDLLGKIAREEAELLARLDRRTAQHHPRDLILHESRERHRHREVGLAGTGRTDAEHDVMVADSIDVKLLVDALGRDDALMRRHIDRIEEDVLQVGIAVAAQDPNAIFDVAAEHRMSALEQLVQIAEQLARHRLFGMASRDAQGGTGHGDTNAERLLDGAD